MSLLEDFTAPPVIALSCPIVDGHAPTAALPSLSNAIKGQGGDDLSSHIRQPRRQLFSYRLKQHGMIAAIDAKVSLFQERRVLSGVYDDRTSTLRRCASAGAYQVTTSFSARAYIRRHQRARPGRRQRCAVGV